MASRALPFRNLKRTFVTPEGVDLQLELGSAGSRAGAFMIDFVLMTVILVIVTIAFVMMAVPGAQKLLVILWLIGAFVLRNGWFSLFEMGNRGATPGKRLMGLRVVARDGARLTGAAVIARNAMREIEIFLPLSFLGQQTAEGTADTFLVLFALIWSGIFLFFPCSTATGCGSAIWSRALGSCAGAGSSRRSGRRSSAGAAELSRSRARSLRHLRAADARGGPAQRTPDAIATVARTIREKAGLPDDGDDYGFLSDYYAALCVRLEAGMLVGRRRESKFG